MSSPTIADQLRQLYADGRPRSSRTAWTELKEVKSMHQICRASAALRQAGYLALNGSVDQDAQVEYVLAANPATEPNVLPEDEAHVISAPRRKSRHTDRLTAVLEEQFRVAEGTLADYLHDLGDQTLIRLIQLRDAAKAAAETRRATC